MESMVLEMRKMKDSGIEWIGEIPEGWEVAKLKNYASISSGTALSKDDYDPFGSIPVIGSNGKIGTTYKANNYSEVITTGRVGSIGTAHIVQVSWITDNTLIIDSHGIDRNYLSYIIPNFDFSFMLAGTAQPLITATKLKNQFVPVPPLQIQDSIVQHLNIHCHIISLLLSKTHLCIEEYKKLKQAVITQAVTKGVHGEREMKDSGVEWIGEIPKNWSIGKLKYYWISVDSGVSVNAADRPTDNLFQYGVLKTSAVSKFIFNPQEHKQVNTDEYGRVSCPVTADCIIVSRMNTPDLVGACGYVEKDYPNLFLPDRLWKISFKNDVSAKFIWYYLNNKMVRSYISSLSTGTSSTMQNISQGQFGNIFVCLPDSIEQKEIADYLDAKCAEIDKLIAKKEQLLKELESYKKSLIYEVVTGKREV